MSTTTRHPAIEEVPLFPSLEAMRYVHGDLLRRQREQGVSQTLIGEVEDFIRCAQATGRVLDTDRDRTTAQTLIDYWVTALYRATNREQGEPVLAEFDLAATQRNLTEEDYPYGAASVQGKPLLSVGIKRIVAECIDRIEHNQLVALVGPVGSGRSSVLTSGLLPALREGGALGSKNWRFYPVITPEREPLARLAGLFCPPDVDPQQWTAQQVEQMRNDGGHLASLVAAGGDAPALLAIDRFELLFTCGDKADRQAMIANLLELIRRPGAGAAALVMNSDFLSQVDQVPELSDAFQQGLIYLAFTTDELRQAIQEPAQLMGLKFDEGLVDRLILDIQGDPATLTLLHFTLRKLWEQRSGDRITWDAYNRVGGGRRALERAAELVYSELSAADQALAESLFLRVVRPSTGQEYEVQIVPLAALYAEHGEQARVDRIVDAFVRAGLLRYVEAEPSAEPKITFSHEALVRHWPRLAEWLGQRREEQRRRLRVAEAARTWQAQDRSPDALWRGSLLVEAEQYPDLSQLETEFVQASRLAVEQAERAREQVLKREAEQARALAQAERKYSRLISVLAVALAVAALVAVFMAFEATAARREESQRAIELQVVNGNQLLEAGDSSGAALWYQAAFKKSQELPNWRQQSEPHQRRLNAIFRQQAPLQYLWRLSLDPLQEAPEGVRTTVVLVSPDDKFVLAAAGAPGATQGVAHLYDLTTGEKMDFALAHDDGRVLSAAFGRADDQLIIATGSASANEEHGTVKVWDAKSGRLLRPAISTSGRVNCLAFSADGRYLAVASGKPGAVAGELMLHTLGNDSQARAVAVEGPVNHVSFDPGDKPHLLLSAGGTAEGGGWVQVHKLEDLDQSVFSERATMVVNRAVFSPDGRWIASASGQQGHLGEAWIWEWEREESRGRQIPHADGVTWVEFSPCGGFFVTTCHDGTAKLWTGKALNGRPAGSWVHTWEHGTSVHQANFSDDGRYLATASRDYTARVWEVDRLNKGNKKEEWAPGTRELVVPPCNHQGTVWHAVFSHGGEKLITGSQDTVRVWKIEQPLRNITPGREIHLTANGRLLAIASNTQEETPGGQTTGPGDYDLKEVRIGGEMIYISANGKWAATVNKKEAKQKEVMVWEIANSTREPAMQVEPFTERINQVAISEDGRFLAVALGDEDASTGSAVVFDVNNRESIDVQRPDGALLLRATHKGGVLAVSFDAQNRRLLTASSDNRARVWDLETRQALAEMSHAADVVDAAFSDAGDRIVTAGMDQMAIVWAADGARLAAIPHSGYVRHARFSADGKQLVTVAQDGKARVWFLGSGKPADLRPQLVAVLKHGAGLQQASFVTSGQRVVTVGYHTPKILPGEIAGSSLKPKTIQWGVWDVSPGKPLTVLPVIAARQLNSHRQQLEPLTSRELIRLWNKGEDEYRKQFEADEASRPPQVAVRGQSE